jgi:hypothetical protein
VVDTSKSFTISAWAYVPYNSNSYTVTAQNGSTSYGFWLGYDHTLNSWALETVQADATTTNTYAAAGAAGSAAPGAWTQLIGTYDSTSGKLSLYVNGVLQSRQDVWPTPFAAPGQFMIGDGKLNGALTNAMHGGVADVRVYPLALTGHQAGWLAGNTGFTPPTGLVYGLPAPTALTSNDGTTSACSTDPAHPAASASLTPKLGATLAGTTAHADFELRDVTNPQTPLSLYYNGPGAGSASGATVSVTAPSLTNGHEYAFSARAHTTGSIMSTSAPYCYVQISNGGQAATSATGAAGAFFDNAVYRAAAGPVSWSGPLTTLTWQTDGNLVLSKKNGTAIWSANTAGNPNAVLALQSDGGLAIYASMPLNSAGGALIGDSIWTANVGGKNGNYLVVQTDGNAVVYGTTGALFGMNGNVWSLDNVAVNRCLDSNAQGQLYTNACSAGTGSQQWVISDNGDGTYSFKDSATTLCLDGNGASTYTMSCNGGGYQRWSLSWGGSGWIFKSQAASPAILDCNAGGTPYFNTLNAGPYQQWD